MDVTNETEPLQVDAPQVDASSPAGTNNDTVDEQYLDFIVHKYHHKEIQTELASNDISVLEQGMNELTVRMYELKTDANKIKVGTKDWFDKDDKVSFYTGLPNFYVLSTIFDFVSSKVPHSGNSSLTQEFVSRVCYGINSISFEPYFARFSIQV